MPPSNDATRTQIAVIGMAGRFPGAPNIHAFWDVLRDGRETVDGITLEEWARELDCHPTFLDDPHLVKMRPRIEGVDFFDAAFYGYSPRDAQILDPQQRLFLECCWEALENAGYDSERFEGSGPLAIARAVGEEDDAGLQ